MYRSVLAALVPIFILVTIGVVNLKYSSSLPVDTEILEEAAAEGEEHPEGEEENEEEHFSLDSLNDAPPIPIEEDVD